MFGPIIYAALLSTTYYSTESHISLLVTVSEHEKQI